MPALGFILFAVTIFVSSNIDGLLVLMALFCIPTFHHKSVVYGQFLGSSILILASLACSRFSLWVPAGYIGLIGLVPLGIGLQKLISGTGEDGQACAVDSPSTDKISPANICSVTLVTLSNGGDNLSVYIPVFAVRPMSSILVMAGIFILMTGLWCGLAYCLARHRYIGVPARKYGERLLPWVMIALGMYILSGTALMQRLL